MRTTTIELEVSAEKAAEWTRFIRSVMPTTYNPTPGDRIMAAATRVLVREQARQRERRRQGVRKGKN